MPLQPIACFLRNPASISIGLWTHNLRCSEFIELTLFISKATVTAEGREGSIRNFKEITLEDCAITQPAGAVVDNSQGAVVLNGEIVKSEGVITRGSDGINTPTIDTTAKQGIYTLSGVKLGGEVKDLPKGVYIVNGKKVVK